MRKGVWLGMGCGSDLSMTSSDSDPNFSSGQMHCNWLCSCHRWLPLPIFLALAALGVIHHTSALPLVVSTAVELQSAVSAAPQDGSLHSIHIVANISLSPLCGFAGETCSALNISSPDDIEDKRVNIALIGIGSIVLDAGGNASVSRRAILVRNARLVVSNITFTGGYAKDASAGIFGSTPSGGAVAVERLGEVIFRDCFFKGNMADRQGGAVVAYGEFIHDIGSTEKLSYLRFDRCQFESNTCTGGTGTADGGGNSYAGGAVATLGARAEFYDCIFDNNAVTSTGIGGAIFVSSTYLNGHSVLTVSGCTFRNSRGSKGSSIKLYRAPDSAPTTAVVVGTSFLSGNAFPDIHVDNSLDSSSFGKTKIFLFNNTYNEGCVDPSCCSVVDLCCCPAPSDWSRATEHEDNVFIHVAETDPGFFVTVESFTAVAAGLCPRNHFCPGGGVVLPCPTASTSALFSRSSSDCIVSTQQKTDAPTGKPTSKPTNSPTGLPTGPPTLEITPTAPTASSISRDKDGNLHINSTASVFINGVDILDRIETLQRRIDEFE